jgi:hypothetical protein
MNAGFEDVMIGRAEDLLFATNARIKNLIIQFV